MSKLQCLASVPDSFVMIDSECAFYSRSISLKRCRVSYIRPLVYSYIIPLVYVR